jgi:hypothetical protein
MLANTDEPAGMHVCADVRFVPKADMPDASSNVGF